MSMDADALLQCQEELQGRIARTYENLKKSGAAKITEGSVESRLKALEASWSKFEQNHEALSTLYWKSACNTNYVKEDYFALVEESFLSQRGTMLDLLHSMRSRDERAEPTEAVAAAPQGRRTLPRIQLPTFSGRYEEWPAFRDLFQSLVIKDASVSGVERLHYLRTSVKGEAEQLIRNLPTTEENFTRAWSMMTEHYENRRLLVRSCFSSFTALPKMKTESTGDLKRIFHGMLSTVGTLESIGRPISNCSDLFVHLVVEMLDPRSRREWETAKKQPKEKKDFAEAKQLCPNCLGKHQLADCQSKKTCAACNARHHSSTHDAYVSSGSASTETSTSLHVQRRATKEATVLLATARIDVSDRHGIKHRVRALIDSGSEVSLISEALTQRLQLQRTAAPVAILGIGGQRTVTSNGRVNMRLSSTAADFTMHLTALVLPRISAYGTRVKTAGGEWPHVHGLHLADPDFRAADPVELLLGADAFSQIIEKGLRKGGSRAPIAQRTTLGWILSGVVGGVENDAPALSHQCTIDDQLATLIGRFWEQEEYPRTPAPLTGDEQRCEELFTGTHTRTSEGRYMVRLPVSSDLPALSDTRRAALRLLRCMERRFTADSGMRRLYGDFMAEYEQLHHMTPVPPLSGEATGRCYLPHHGVLKTTGTAAKIRVVFNGSSRLPSGESLNQFLLPGPNLLPALPDVLMRWRAHRFAMVADIEKMYRQILVHPEDRNLQRILWRTSGDEPVKEFQLNTVTYGLSCAPYLAIQTLHQLASDEEDQFPKGAAVIRRDTYVDDILTGADTLEEARDIREQLTHLCAAGGFPLKKWAASTESLLDGIPLDHRQQKNPPTWDHDVEHATLGLQWHPREDAFSFRVTPVEPGRITKRSVLSQTARLFDPLGWLAPVVIGAKIIIQALWLQQLEWDEPVTPGDERAWLRIQAELPALGEIRVPRWIHTRQADRRVELHGFADASERAYAAAVYARIHPDEDTEGPLLLAAKAKVAPLRQVSLPRLELCAAALLVKLVAHVERTMELHIARTHLWSDSTVTLAWIRGHPSRWKTFVANRVADIQRTLPEARWHHVPSEDNPADCATRGLSPRELLRHPLWWRGPSWLPDSDRWPARATCATTEDELPEQRARVHVVAAEAKEDDSMLQRYSSLHRLLRVTAWCRRWLGARASQERPVDQGPTVSPQELENARRGWIRQTQSAWFKAELRSLAGKRPLPGRSPLIKLTPFVDNDGMLRVGGRLKHSLLSPDERHPVILPAESHLTVLIIDACHRKTMHGGVQLTLGTLRQHYWIPGGRAAVKRHLHRCVTCVRWRAASPRTMMGDLPQPRVTASRPFTHTGVDYAGPVQLRAAKGRGHRAYKAFLAIFVCFSTKAVHLEVVSDYSTDAFLAAFRRFVSRRGLCHTVYSDQGTTFIGADSQLRALFLEANKGNAQLAGQLANDGVRWSFNPPAAPHFGGLWEAAVKSVKHHLRRVIGESTLTFEEMSTVLSQIEACLNSRPLLALTDDPEDVSALTPGHFLIGSA
ncbi:gag-pol protein, partial [Lasius niger]